MCQGQVRSWPCIPQPRIQLITSPIGGLVWGLDVWTYLPIAFQVQISKPPIQPRPPPPPAPILERLMSIVLLTLHPVSKAPQRRHWKQGLKEAGKIGSGQIDKTNPFKAKDSTRMSEDVEPESNQESPPPQKKKGADLFWEFFSFFFGIVFRFSSGPAKYRVLQHFLAKLTHFTSSSTSPASFSTSPACPINIPSITNKWWVTKSKNVAGGLTGSKQ